MIKFIKLSKVQRDSRFSLDEIWINESHVVRLQSAPEMKKLLEEGHMPQDLDKSHDFTSITTNVGGITETHVVVGSASAIAQRLSHDKRNLLKG
tara:strand:- start:102 stop:383 length:282 start_codon:yes stop_codon:yes gene_type:complete